AVERHGLSGRAAQVGRESELPSAGDTRDLALARLAPEMEPALEEHAQAGSADETANDFKPPSGFTASSPCRQRRGRRAARRGEARETVRSRSIRSSKEIAVISRSMGQLSRPA